MAPVAIAAIVIGAALMAYATVKQGEMEAERLKFEAAQAEDNKNLAKLEAAQQENDRRRQLNAVLAAQDAEMAAAGGTVGNFGTFGALQTEENRLANRDIANIRLMGDYQSRAFGLQEKQKKSAARTVKQTAYLSAAGGLLSTAGKSYMSYGGGGGS